MRPPPSTHSIVALKRWSCKSKDLPGVQNIKTIHVYDFDNTLFMSPLPNPALWNGESIGRLQSDNSFINGGWWHDPAILAATGDGIDKEEPRGWQGHWNEVIVKLVETSITQKDALTVLLTGRGETNFADITNRMLNAKGLDCDLVALKPEAGPQNQRFANTMDFKQAFLRDLCFTYNRAENIVVYEDRPKHVKGFREFFERFNKSLLSHRIDEPPPSRKPIVADIVHVCEMANYLDMETEASEVAKLLKRHNAALAESRPGSINGAMNIRWTIKEKYIYCGYLISATDSTRLISLANIPANLIDSSDVRLMANNILISPHQPSSTMLDRVGGRGKLMTWQVTGIATLENRIWAAKVQKVGEGKVYTHDPNPVVVLGCRKGTRPIDAKKIQKWTDLPGDQRIVFETVVGDKVVLGLEQGEGEYLPSPNRGQLKQNVNAGTKRRYRDRGSRSPEYQGRENIPFEGARKVSDMNGQNDGMERDDGSWVPAPMSLAQSNGRQGNNYQQSGNRNFSGTQNRGQGNRGGGQQQARYFNQQQNGDGSNQQNQTQGQQRQNRNQNRAGQQNRNRGGRGGQQGPQGYKSLDDYGPSGNGGLDGANDPRAGSGMEMNY
jgi:HAD domain family 1 in Swiss Army Knife RNA repair proteins